LPIVIVDLLMFVPFLNPAQLPARIPEVALVGSALGPPPPPDEGRVVPPVSVMPGRPDGLIATVASTPEDDAGPDDVVVVGGAT
jgi:hypothetical protein